MTGVVSVFIALLVWRFLIVFGGAVFEGVGLSPRAAAFEARSAIVGAGYTTSQSECIVQNPVSRRVASMLIVTGYFGPATILTLLGAAFVLPTKEDLSERFTVLVALVGGLYVIDRIGVIRVIGSRPARAVARRMLAATTFETWTLVGERAIAVFVVPADEGGAQRVADALAADDVRLLAVEPGAVGPPEFPDADSTTPGPGDKLVVFGPRATLEPLGAVT